jgi:hypothetical protein
MTCPIFTSLAELSGSLWLIFFVGEFTFCLCSELTDIELIKFFRAPLDFSVVYVVSHFFEPHGVPLWHYSVHSSRADDARNCNHARSECNAEGEVLHCKVCEELCMFAN